jgi:hypothetical protein
VQAEITDLNCNLYTCGKSGDCLCQAVEGPMHVADERESSALVGPRPDKVDGSEDL